MSDSLLQRSVTTVGREEPGEHDEDVAQDDVDHAAVAA